MRYYLLILMAVISYASSYPKIFSSAGDSVYESMDRYRKIKGLDVHLERPELFEAFLIDANASLQKGIAIDALLDDPEAAMDKSQIKAYAKTLRILSNRHEAIDQQLESDIQRFYQKGDYQSLGVMYQAGFYLDAKILRDLKKYEKEANRPKPVKKTAKAPEPTKTVDTLKPEQKPTQTTAASASTPVAAIEPVQIQASVIPPVQKSIAPVEDVKRELTPLEYYQESLKSLKEELYALREVSNGVDEELQNQQKTACLNDITAVNYWMIRVLQDQNDACGLRDAIKQMKSYDKAASDSCGRSAMRYVEWHGRIRPYVGKRLFEAEANCVR